MTDEIPPITAETNVSSSSSPSKGVELTEEEKYIQETEEAFHSTAMNEEPDEEFEIQW